MIGRRQLDGTGSCRAIFVELAHEVRVGARAHAGNLDAQAVRKLELAPIEAEQEQEARCLDADGVDGEGVVELRHADGQTFYAQLTLERGNDLLVLDVDDGARLHEQRVEILRGFVLDVELGTEVPAEGDDGCDNEEITHETSAPTPSGGASVDIRACGTRRPWSQKRRADPRAPGRAKTCGAKAAREAAGVAPCGIPWGSTCCRSARA